MERKDRRVSVLRRSCPKCGAQPGQPCVGKRRSRQPRKTPHVQRYRSANIGRPNNHPEAVIGSMNVLPGLHPWLRFKSTREQWIECYGIDLTHIDRKAAETYLEGEADFFDTFDE